jgi:hypothetical protein
VHILIGPFRGWLEPATEYSIFGRFGPCPVSGARLPQVLLFLSSRSSTLETGALPACPTIGLNPHQTFIFRR